MTKTLTAEKEESRREMPIRSFNDIRNCLSGDLGSIDAEFKRYRDYFRNGKHKGRKNNHSAKQIHDYVENTIGKLSKIYSSKIQGLEGGLTITERKTKEYLTKIIRYTLKGGEEILATFSPKMEKTIGEDADIIRNMPKRWRRHERLDDIIDSYHVSVPGNEETFGICHKKDAIRYVAEYFISWLKKTKSA